MGAEHAILVGHSATLRKIDEFRTKRAVAAKKVRKLPARRRIRSVAPWAPDVAAAADDPDPTDDPDPPLTS